MLTGHKSHQVGLDADIWLTPMPSRTLTFEEREEISAESMVKDPFTVDPGTFTSKHVRLIKRAASYPEVARIFVYPAIKKALCEQGGNLDSDRTWLSKVQPWWNHHYHFHVRLSCPKGSLSCKDQNTPSGDDGCGPELTNWYVLLRKSAIREAKRHPPATRLLSAGPRLRVSDLPDECRSVLAAGEGPVPPEGNFALLTARATSSKDAGPPVPVLDPEALRALIKPVTIRVPVPDRNPLH